jgi:P4 family phage/plasmid primase-like protien
MLPPSVNAAPPFLLPHTPRFFTTVSLPYNFDPRANCPIWLEFLKRNLENDPERIAMLQEWFGYCVTFDTSYQKFLLLEGEGSNGKSVICAAFTAFLGQKNVSHVMLENFGKDFYLTETLGKLANVAAEIGEIDKVAEGQLKAFTSGDRMTFNRKNKSMISALPTARLVFSTNNRPRFSDRSAGLWRRMLILPLRVQIQEQEKVHGMDKTDWWEKSGELPGIFNWALLGKARLRFQRRFTEPKISSEAREDYRSESNPARAFLQEQFEECRPFDGDIVSSETYQQYRTWCENHGNKPLAMNQFVKEIARVFPKSEQVRNIWGNDGRRQKGFRGIRMSTTAGTGDSSEHSSGVGGNGSSGILSVPEFPSDQRVAVQKSLIGPAG